MATWKVNVTGAIDPNAKSTGGNGAADAGKLLEFGDDGSIQGKTGLGGGAAVYGETDALTSPAVQGYSSQNGEGGRFQSVSGDGVSGSSTSKVGVRATSASATDPALHIDKTDPTGAGPLAFLHNIDGEGLEVANDGSLDWTAATGASATRTNLGLGDLAVKNTVATGDIDDNAVTFAKLENISSGHLIGRHSAGSGDPQSIGIDGGLELQGANLRRAALTGDVTASAGNNTTTIANDAVTNAKLANMAQATIKGRQAGAGTGDPEDLTASQARTAMGLGTAAVVNTGTGSGDVPTTSQADARYLTPFAYSLLPAWTVGTQATTAITLTDVTDTELTVPGAGMYEFEYRVVYNANATTTGAGFTIRNTVGGTVDYSAIEMGADTLAADRSTFRGGFQFDFAAASSRATTGNAAIVRGRAVFNAASAIRLQFRTEIATTTTITVTDVIGFIRRVA
jgi:hypothetical protein